MPVHCTAGGVGRGGTEREHRGLAGKRSAANLAGAELSGPQSLPPRGVVFAGFPAPPSPTPPQSAILGMHNIVERPVAVHGQVIIRPIMDVALSYDHRINEGKESVSFLMAVKQMIEDPNKMVFGNKEPGEVLLGL